MKWPACLSACLPACLPVCLPASSSLLCVAQAFVAAAACDGKKEEKGGLTDTDADDTEDAALRIAFAMLQRKDDAAHGQQVDQVWVKQNGES